MENSFWLSGKREYPVLDKDIECDVCVIGAGVAGLACAYELSKSGLNTVVLEADRVASGQTGRSSAIISYAHDIIYSRLIKLYGLESAREYYNQNTLAQKRIKKIIEEENIECGYKPYDMVLYAKTKKGAKDIESEYKAYQKIGVQCDYIQDTGLPFGVLKAIRLNGQAVMNPFKYAQGLALAIEKNGGRIYEKTLVNDSPHKNMLRAGGFTVKAKYFVVCTHFPYINAPGYYFLKLYQHRSYNVVFKNSEPLKYVYECADDNGFEYRQAGDGLVLCGGANVRTGRYHYESCYQKVIDAVNNEFMGGLKGESGQAEIISKFSAQDCMTFDLLPVANNYSNNYDNVFVVTGFNKWGFTTSVVCAHHIKGLILNGGNILSVKRKKKLLTLIKGVANTGALIKEFSDYVLNTSVKQIERIKKGQGAIVKLKGKRLGVYRDEGGEIHAVKATCTHLGCPLKWNKDELTFDCACHGSRFDIYGKVLDNPALENLEQIKINAAHKGE